MKEAMFYKKGKDQEVHCFLCNHHCHIKPGRLGICGVRQNRDGALWSLVYGRVIAEHIDPIEKKPLFHFHPGSRSYSIATVGCNFRCRFCQNADISQTPRDSGKIFGSVTAPERIVAEAKKNGCATIAYTYTEPTIFMEYALDVARLADSEGLRNIFVSNGYMTEEALDAVSPHLHAANVDLKAFTEDFYVKQCGARLEPVLSTLKRMKDLGIWLEVTTLVIPGLNDSPDELAELAAFLVSLDADIPWHISRFHPTYRMMDRPVTPVKTLQAARDIGVKAGLRYVYVGNVPGDAGENTFCPQCGVLLLERFGFATKQRGIQNGTCSQCGLTVAGVGMP
jgi:pyruvate formate lyase activating enzyme